MKQVDGIYFADRAPINAHTLDVESTWGRREVSSEQLVMGFMYTFAFITGILFGVVLFNLFI